MVVATAVKPGSRPAVFAGERVVDSEPIQYFLIYISSPKIF